MPNIHYTALPQRLTVKTVKNHRVYLHLKYIYIIYKRVFLKSLGILGKGGGDGGSASYTVLFTAAGTVVFVARCIIIGWPFRHLFDHVFYESVESYFCKK